MQHTYKKVVLTVLAATISSSLVAGDMKLQILAAQKEKLFAESKSVDDKLVLLQKEKRVWQKQSETLSQKRIRSEKDHHAKNCLQSQSYRLYKLENQLAREKAELNAKIANLDQQEVYDSNAEREAKWRLIGVIAASIIIPVGWFAYCGYVRQ